MKLYKAWKLCSGKCCHSCEISDVEVTTFGINSIHEPRVRFSSEATGMSPQLHWLG